MTFSVAAQTPTDLPTSEVSVTTLYEQALDKTNSGNLAEGLADYTQVLKLKPDFTEAYLRRGII